MTQQSTVTVTGYVGADPKMVSAEGKVPCCVFRLASTRRYFNRKNGKWEDLPTTWMSVRSYRQLAQNVKDSIACGDPVVVNGQLVSNSWKDKEGNARTTLCIEAQAVGHDLCRGVARFERRMPNEGHAEGAEGSSAEAGRNSSRVAAADGTEGEDPEDGGPDVPHDADVDSAAGAEEEESEFSAARF
ncbi:MAG: single-stranded DNA-binding protein [Bifidobacteriaceae bacterium]|nr:single-stranded DNA-binding protein [Bifidobacteriaceae bacterium]